MLLFWKLGWRRPSLRYRSLLIEYDLQTNEIVKGYFPWSATGYPRKKDLAGREWMRVKATKQADVDISEADLAAAMGRCAVKTAVAKVKYGPPAQSTHV